jgi:anti-sigma B factor antagonist
MARDEEIKVRTEKRGKTTIVWPEGDIDLGRSPMLRESLRKASADRPGRLVIDLSLVEYMDSSGVATLVEALQLSRKNSTSLVLCGMKDKVRSIFEIARLDTVFTIADSLDSAVQG